MSDTIDAGSLAAENAHLRVLLAAAAIDQGGRLIIPEQALIMVPTFNLEIWRNQARRVIYVEVHLRKEPDVQDNHAEERRGQVVLDSDRTERPDTGDQSGVSNQGLLPAYGTEGGSEAENESDC